MCFKPDQVFLRDYVIDPYSNFLYYINQQKVPGIFLYLVVESHLSWNPWLSFPFTHADGGLLRPLSSHCCYSKLAWRWFAPGENASHFHSVNTLKARWEQTHSLSHLTMTPRGGETEGNETKAGKNQQLTWHLEREKKKKKPSRFNIYFFSFQ